MYLKPNKCLLFYDCKQLNREQALKPNSVLLDQQLNGKVKHQPTQ
ncbi:hypothetical protein KUB3007_P40250 (plasmid) [Enterococcus faecalis]|uniref:Uncharacterized protein n=1 Tax=Enterococcus faecalis TaxID=1351 RepID=A0A1U7ENW7_ENTFL|nr:hypothetical protein [Enterococcus faecalis]AWH59109.1 hypothetical protein [Enterococcus faecalis]BBD26605.1 hypothetical protein KUB3006_P40250 [Enterococcus faecalis]BBD29646.1 hypothetical protein KUB3007_P40250 [Enterococcus faecalis]